MYIIKKELNIKDLLKDRTRKSLAEEVEVNERTIRRIINGHQTPYTTAYTITKHIDNELEISDIFNKNIK